MFGVLRFRNLPDRSVGLRTKELKVCLLSESMDPVIWLARASDRYPSCRLPSIPGDQARSLAWLLVNNGDLDGTTYQYGKYANHL